MTLDEERRIVVNIAIDAGFGVNADWMVFDKKNRKLMFPCEMFTPIYRREWSSMNTATSIQFINRSWILNGEFAGSYDFEFEIFKSRPDTMFLYVWKDEEHIGQSFDFEDKPFMVIRKLFENCFQETHS